MRIAALAAAAGLLWMGVAGACDDYVGKCDIKAWRWYSPIPGMLTIEGSASCDSGCDSGLANIRIDGPQNLAIRVSIDRPALTIGTRNN